MRDNSVRQALRVGGFSLGCTLGLGSPAAAEMLAQAGFEWLVFEREHTPLSWSGVQHMLQATAATACVPLVRLTAPDPREVQQALDLGAQGVVVPLVRTPEEVAHLVRASRYPPAGTRSFGPLRAARYGLDQKDYLARANEHVLVVLIIETAEAVANLPALAQLDGVDVLYFGPFDLSMALGLDPLAQPHPEIEAIFTQALALERAGGCAVGLNVNTVEQLKRRRREGFRFLSFGPDHSLLLNAATVGLEAWRAIGN